MTDAQLTALVAAIVLHREPAKNDEELRKALNYAAKIVSLGQTFAPKM